MKHDQAWKLRDLIPELEIYPRAENDTKTKRLAITSGKGGVGKSLIALNLALLMAKSEQRILLIDGDINLSQLPILTDTSPKYSFSDVQQGYKQIKDVIYEYQPNCSILPTGSGSLELLDDQNEFQRRFDYQFKQLNKDYDHILIDTASGISSLVFSELASCDEIMVVITPEPTSVADAYAVIKIMSFYYPHIPIHLIFNLVESEDEAFEVYKKFNLIVQKFLHRQVNYLGFVFKDDHVAESIKVQKPLALKPEITPFINQLNKIKDRWLEAFADGYRNTDHSKN